MEIIIFYRCAQKLFLYGFTHWGWYPQSAVGCGKPENHITKLRRPRAAALYRAMVERYREEARTDLAWTQVAYRLRHAWLLACDELCYIRCAHGRTGREPRVVAESVLPALKVDLKYRS